MGYLKRTISIVMKDTRKAADIKHNDFNEYLIAIPLTLFKGYWKGKKDFRKFGLKSGRQSPSTPNLMTRIMIKEVL